MVEGKSNLLGDYNAQDKLFVLVAISPITAETSISYSIEVVVTGTNLVDYLVKRVTINDRIREMAVQEIDL